MALSRRKFLQSSTALAATTLSAPLTGRAFAAQSIPFAPGPGNKWPGRVAINFNKNAVSNLTSPQTNVIKKMVDDAILLLTGQSSVGAAWKELFPASLSLQSKIAIKINIANGGLPGPHWSSVQAITEGLQRMDFNGTSFPAANITLYDMKFGAGMDALNYSKDNFPGCTREYTALVNGGDGAMNNHKYASTLKNADFLINVFSPRGHTYPPEGSRFTLGFKSHVGTYASEAKTEGPSLHAKLMENLVAMNCTGPVYAKNVLSICSGIFGLIEGIGPGDTEQRDYKQYAATMDPSITEPINPSTIMLSTDPIAVEMQCIKMMRINNSGNYAREALPPYLQASAGISGMMLKMTHDIGIIEEKDIEVRRIINDVVSIDRTAPSRVNSRKGTIWVAAAPDRGTFFEFSLPAARSGNLASIAIHDSYGRLVHSREVRIQGERNQFSWNNRGTNSAPVSPGGYIVNIESGKSRIAKQFAVIF
jgi:hypothetical protein